MGIKEKLLGSAVPTNKKRHQMQEGNQEERKNETPSTYFINNKFGY